METLNIFSGKKCKYDSPEKKNPDMASRLLEANNLGVIVCQLLVQATGEE